ncbi:MAG: DUF58 domain-containing protein [Betaproteobacteria bacterium]|nr:DUF58 domain-containing protein [Betaproteobacteria bacterium]
MFRFRRKPEAAATLAQDAASAAVPAPEPAPLLKVRRRAEPETLLRRLEWTVIRRLDGLLQGDYRTLLRGFGLDLADLREYQWHDDVRYIDWNVTARMQVPHVREFQEDREVTAWFLLDLSGSIDFGSQQVRKRTVSAELVGVLARLLTRHGNRVGAVLHGDSATQVVPASGGRRQVLHLLDRMLRQGEQQRRAGGPAGRETNLNELFEKAHQVMKRRSVVFIVSDFISTPGWTKAINLLARKHEVVAVRLYDAMEMELPDVGFVSLQDSETGEQLFIDTHDRGFRRRFAEAATLRESVLRTTLAEAGVDCLELATDDNVGEALLRFTELRKRRSQLAAGGGMLRKAMAV